MSKKAAAPPHPAPAATFVLMVEYDAGAVDEGHVKESIDVLLESARGYGRVTKAFVQYAPTEAHIVTLVGDAE